MKTNRLIYGLELAAVAALYFFENNTGTRAVLAVSVLLPLFSILCARCFSRKATFLLDIPALGEKGKPFVCQMQTPPLFLCEGYVCLRLQNDFTREETYADAAGNSAVSLSVLHGGQLTLSAESAEIRDLFGLCRFAVSPIEPRTVFVPIPIYSAQVTLDPSTPQTREDSRFSAVRRGSDCSETQNIRPYLPGDPVRQIHWKLSAKTGQTLLREAGAPLTGDLLLALAVDEQQTPDPDALEAAASGLLSASKSLLEQGIAHHVALWRHAPLAVSSPEDWEQAQRLLLAPPTAPSEASFFFARIALFSPSAVLDAAEPDTRVTLVLPEGTQALVSDIPVAFFGAHTPFLAL